MRALKCRSHCKNHSGGSGRHGTNALVVTEHVADNVNVFTSLLTAHIFPITSRYRRKKLEQMATLHADAVTQCGLPPCGVSALYVNVNAYCWRTKAQQLFVSRFI